MNKKALITGITGQDGSYLTELLLSKGYDVHGIIRQSSSFNTGRIEHLYQDPHKEGNKLYLHYGDVTDAGRVTTLISEIMPDEIYHLAAQSHVAVSFEIPQYTIDVICSGITNILEAICKIKPDTLLYNASSSEMFGNAPAPQNEKTPFNPQSPYACAKVLAHNMVVNYRDAYSIFACNGILFNHESFRRKETFVTKKIISAAVKINQGRQEKLYLGNLNAKRDWGHADDYVNAMYLMLQHHVPDDYVIATNESHTVKELLETVFSMLRMNYNDHVVIDKKYYRPNEVNVLQGDYSKAAACLKWKPKLKFKQLIIRMIKEEMDNNHEFGQ